MPADSDTKMHVTVYALNTHRDNTSIDPPILNKSTRWKLVVSLKPWQLYPLGRNPNTHWTDGWVGPRLWRRGKWKTLCPCHYQTPDYPAHYL